jgi:NAD(P)-dependent dehydrogenase (short-subunit alcohol dehydrogenase family)
LEGKVAIVTGAGSRIGFGRSTTLALVQAGARVAMMDVDPQTLEQTANKVEETAGRHTEVQIVGDVANAEDAKRAVQTAHDPAPGRMARGQRLLSEIELLEITLPPPRCCSYTMAAWRDRTVDSAAAASRALRLALISAATDLRVGQAFGGMELTLRIEVPCSLGLHWCSW